MRPLDFQGAFFYIKRKICMAKVVCKTDNQIFYALIGHPGETIYSIDNRCYQYLKDDPHFLDLRQFNLTVNDGYRFNCHHYKNESYYDILLPYFAKLWGFPFSKQDFIFKYIDTETEGIKLKTATPKRNFTFAAEFDGKEPKEGGFEILTNFDEKDTESAKRGASMFHKQYRGCHACSRIINKTIDNNRKIFLSGDSHLIPMVPILACYYKMVVVMDVRDGQKGHPE